MLLTRHKSCTRWHYWGGLRSVSANWTVDIASQLSWLFITQARILTTRQTSWCPSAANGFDQIPTTYLK